MYEGVLLNQWQREDDPQTEDQLLGRIAYYKARLADIQKAPKHSRHREGWEAVAARLEESQHQLARLRSRRTRFARRL